MDYISEVKGNIRYWWHSPRNVYGIPSVQGQVEVSAIRFSSASLSDLSSPQEKDALRSSLIRSGRGGRMSGEIIFRAGERDSESGCGGESSHNGGEYAHG